VLLVGFRNNGLPHSDFRRQRGQQGHEGKVDGFQVRVAALEYFVDETLEMSRQLDVEARLEQDPVLRRKCKPFAAWAQPFEQTASAIRHPMDSMRAFARRVRSA
jgi:hypothetical protein